MARAGANLGLRDEAGARVTRAMGASVPDVWGMLDEQLREGIGECRGGDKSSPGIRGSKK